MQSLSTSLDRLRFVGPIVLRVSLGIIFVWHGIDKFDAGISNVEGAFDSWGVPLPGLAAPFTAIVEIVAGVALLAGLVTLLVTGPGRFSADEMIGLEPSEMRADRELVGVAS